MHYAFVGHTPALSTLELKSLGLKPQPLTDTIMRLEENPLPVADMLGGTIKMGEQLALVEFKNLETELGKYIGIDPAKNIAVTDYRSAPLGPRDLHAIKKSLARPVRFVSMETSEHELVMLSKQHVAEFNLIPEEGKIAITKTIWIQDGIAWGQRDRERPYQDIKRGMLPPKVARIMVNLATKGEKGTLLDPFCGTGTILVEGAFLGQRVVGSDNDPRAVEGTARNLSWINPDLPHQLQVSDATHVSEWLKQVDYIASEPYLGPLLESRGLPPEVKIRDIARGLDKLYRGALRDWAKLAPKRVVMIIPEFHAYHKIIPTLSVDRIRALGYNTLAQVPYSKPGAVVIRQITVLEKI